MESYQDVCIQQEKSSEFLVDLVELLVCYQVGLDEVVLVLDLHRLLLAVQLFKVEVLAKVEVELELALREQALEHQVQVEAWEQGLLQVEQQAFLKYGCLQLFQDVLHVPMTLVQVKHQLFQNCQALLE